MHKIICVKHINPRCQRAQINWGEFEASKQQPWGIRNVHPRCQRSQINRDEFRAAIQQLWGIRDINPRCQRSQINRGDIGAARQQPWGIRNVHQSSQRSQINRSDIGAAIQQLWGFSPFFIILKNISKIDQFGAFIKRDINYGAITNTPICSETWSWSYGVCYILTRKYFGVMIAVIRIGMAIGLRSCSRSVFCRTIPPVYHIGGGRRSDADRARCTDQHHLYVPVFLWLQDYRV